MEQAAPTECRKSLDQLLEQALAERSREEEQVEVTYELTSDYVSEQHGFRLNPEDAAAASSSQNKEEEDEENEEAPGSFQIERKVRRNSILLGIAIILCFGGFFVLQSLQSSMFPVTGLQSLSLLYFFATFSCILGPIIDQKIGIRWTFLAVSLLEACYVLVFHYYHPVALVICAILLGLGLGPMIRVQKSYLSRNISRLSYVTQAMRNKIQQRYLRIFFHVSKSYYFWGHLAATIIMEYAGTMDSGGSLLSNSTEDVTAVQRTELCYERLCQNGIYPTEIEADDTSSPPAGIPSNATMVFIYVFTTSIAIGGLIVFIFLEKIEVLLEQDPMERSVFYQTMRQIRLILVDKNVRLALPMFVFIGIEQAFIFGDFTRAYISCALGVQSVSFTMMCLGGAHTLGSIGVHLFSQHFQRPIIMAAGLVCQSGLLMVLWLWTPVKDDAAVFYVIAGGWGLCNAIWETLTLTFLASTYPDDWQAPFCTYYQLQWFGMAISFCISPYLCTEIKILALAIFLAVSIIPYTILEFRLHHRSQIQNRTDML
ncbi:protein unc-93 homolog A [Caerostris darwini]|uniref:Protein unc-93 homolog A n=1 Tax=Caerostris darwini TaxID=1538125 RepID=A0AAV4VSP4_9ARAC|nr:protein unc-93 homolog A [Caerostris darwini]